MMPTIAPVTSTGRPLWFEGSMRSGSWPGVMSRTYPTSGAPMRHDRWGAEPGPGRGGAARRAAARGLRGRAAPARAPGDDLGRAPAASPPRPARSYGRARRRGVRRGVVGRRGGVPRPADRDPRHPPGAVVLRRPGAVGAGADRGAHLLGPPGDPQLDRLLTRPDRRGGRPVRRRPRQPAGDDLLAGRRDARRRTHRVHPVRRRQRDQRRTDRGRPGRLADHGQPDLGARGVGHRRPARVHPGRGRARPDRRRRPRVARAGRGLDRRGVARGRCGRPHRAVTSTRTRLPGPRPTACRGRRRRCRRPPGRRTRTA